MKTIFAKKTDIKRDWHLIDADGMVLGRLATRVASILRGKHKPIFTPNVDCGDFVVVINAEKVRLTGGKLQKKAYIHHSGYPGGLKEESAKNIMKVAPERIMNMAVQGMLPKNNLGKLQLKKLKVYKGATHPHEAQNPQPLTIS
ncbi:MAG: 50S ribosomal protein L13 [Nitrospirae bacterium]|nr:50S ribosomal protein L13 [Nitrospirota bacterium]